MPVRRLRQEAEQFTWWPWRRWRRSDHYDVALPLPYGRTCGATAVESHDVLAICNAGTDSWLIRATRNGLDRGVMLRDTNRVRPAILFERGGTLFDVSTEFQASGALEALVWQWVSVRP